MTVLAVVGFALAITWWFGIISFGAPARTLSGFTREDLSGPEIVPIGDGVPILVMLSDGQGSTPAPVVAENVARENADLQARVYCLAFGAGADYGLLVEVARQNNGRAERGYEGFGPEQMSEFLTAELGKVCGGESRNE